MTWKALNDEAPSYTSNLLRKQSQQTINLRSNDNTLVLQPQSTNKYGACAFSCIASHLWNKLPEDIKRISTNDGFKRKLKTHLFRTAYEQ